MRGGTFRCTCNGEEEPPVVEQGAAAQERLLEQLRRRGSTEGESCGSIMSGGTGRNGLGEMHPGAE